MRCLAGAIRLPHPYEIRRRHELETNDLAKKIIQAPDYFKVYGGRIALAVVVFVVAVMLVNHHYRSKAGNLAATEEGIASARDAINQLASMNPMAAAPAQVAARRQALISNAIQAIDTVNERSEDPKYLAKAQVMRGDLYWTAANLTDLPGAATQPTLAMEPKPADALMEAASAYKRVLDAYPDQALPDVTARFGLAAVAENRGQWDEAQAVRVADRRPEHRVGIQDAGADPSAASIHLGEGRLPRDCGRSGGRPRRHLPARRCRPGGVPTGGS